MSITITLSETNVTTPAKIHWEFNDSLFDRVNGSPESSSRVLFANKNTGTLRSPLDARLFTTQTKDDGNPNEPFIRVGPDTSYTLQISGSTRHYENPEICYASVALINTPIADVHDFRLNFGRLSPFDSTRVMLAPDGVIYMMPNFENVGNTTLTQNLHVPSINEVLRRLNIELLGESMQQFLGEGAVVEYNFVYCVQPTDATLVGINQNLGLDLGINGSIPANLISTVDNVIQNEESDRINSKLRTYFQVDPLARLTSAAGRS